MLIRFSQDLDYTCKPDATQFSATGLPQFIYVEAAYSLLPQTNCPGYKHSSFSVSRRYSDFLWLYNQLVERYPGAIIQPLPGKQNLGLCVVPISYLFWLSCSKTGRFAEDFVESRRAGLEKFLRKTVSHSLFQQDADLRLFLESSTFATDVKSPSFTRRWSSWILK